MAYKYKWCDKCERFRHSNHHCHKVASRGSASTGESPSHAMEIAAVQPVCEKLVEALATKIYFGEFNTLCFKDVVDRLKEFLSGNTAASYGRGRPRCRHNAPYNRRGVNITIFKTTRPRTVHAVVHQRFTTMTYWEISPHKESEYDACLLPADNDDDHQLAYDYARDMLEQLWDQIQEDDGPMSVTIELRAGELPSDE